MKEREWVREIKNERERGMKERERERNERERERRRKREGRSVKLFSSSPTQRRK
jgi:hypothetical protein